MYRRDSGAKVLSSAGVLSLLQDLCVVALRVSACKTLLIIGLDSFCAAPLTFCPAPLVPLLFLLFLLAFCRPLSLPDFPKLGTGYFSAGNSNQQITLSPHILTSVCNILKLFPEVYSLNIVGTGSEAEF